jgi:hypothetical protein
VKDELSDTETRALRKRKDEPSGTSTSRKTSRQIAKELSEAAKKTKEEERKAKPTTVGKGLYGKGGYIRESVSPERR